MNKFALAAVSAIALAATPASAVNLVTNGSFVDGLTGWSSFGFTSYTNVIGRTDTFAVLNSCVGANCTSTLGTRNFLRQSLATQAGGLYTLTFYVSETQGATSGLSVFWGGQQVLSVLNPANNTYTGVRATTDYRLFTVENLLATSNSTSLELHGRQDPGSILFDDISVDAAVTSGVPEPATWAMMLAGFGMVGAGMRSRRRSTGLAFA